MNTILTACLLFFSLTGFGQTVQKEINDSSEGGTIGRKDFLAARPME